MTECMFENIETDEEAMTVADAIKIVLWEIIQYNLTGPKPHHKNFPVMTALLQMEVRNG